MSNIVTKEGVGKDLTEEAVIRSAGDMIYLVSCVLNGELPDGGSVSSMNLEGLYAVAEKHQLTAITAIALENTGIKNAAFTQAKGKAIRKNAALDIDRAALSMRLEEEKIWFLPLKGAVLAAYYPQFGMRQMSDNDILIDKSRAEDVREIMKSIGFTVESFGKGIHDEYYKQPVSHFEIHRALFFPDDGKLYHYFLQTESRLKKDEGKSERSFSHEDFYIYLIAHEYKHYSTSVTGLRSLLDIYVFWKEFGGKLNKQYLERELETLGLTDFEKNNRDLALRLFSGEALSAREEDRLRFYVLSGVYGTTLNEIKRQGRWRYIRKKIFLPYERMVLQYPVLRRLPFLLPVCWLLRVIGQFTRNNGRIRRKLRFIFHSGHQAE